MRDTRVLNILLSRPLLTFNRDPNTFVKFIVDTGDNEKTFTVHHEVVLKVLILSSASMNPFLERESGDYRLKDISEQVFGLLV